MSRRLKDFLATDAGNMGAQSDFLVECGVSAHLGVSGAPGSTRAQRSETCSRAPEHSQTTWEHNSPATTGDSALCSRDPAPYAPEKNEAGTSTAWTTRAGRLIGDLADEDLRATLTDLFEETAATLEYEQNRPRSEAEQYAYGALVFRMLERGMDVRVVS